MAQTPWQMADVGKEFSHQSALFAWAAMCRAQGLQASLDPKSYTVAGYAREKYAFAGDVWPELKWLHAIKNQGHGDRVRGSRSKAEGVREGVFDTFLPAPRECREGQGLYCGNGHAMHCGLYIELKTPDRINHKNGGASDPQLEFQAFALQQGYAAVVCHGWEAAREAILAYLKGELQC